MPLCFDLSRPFGPFDDGVECCVSSHSISFSNGKDCGYTHYVQCSPLRKSNAIHVVTFRISGLKQEYGLNAIAVVLNDEDQDIAELSGSKYCEYSQQFAPYPECCVTLALDDVSGSLQLLVTAAPIVVGAKRARSSEDDDAATNDHPQWHHGAKDKWTCSSISDVKVWSKVTTITLGDVMPRIGLRLCPLISCKATIAECPLAVKAVLAEESWGAPKTSSEISERTMQFYKPGIVETPNLNLNGSLITRLSPSALLHAHRTTFVEFMKKKIHDARVPMIGEDTMRSLLIGSGSDKSYLSCASDPNKDEALMIVAKAMFPDSYSA